MNQHSDEFILGFSSLLDRSFGSFRLSSYRIDNVKRAPAVLRSGVARASLCVASWNEPLQSWILFWAKPDPSWTWTRCDGSAVGYWSFQMIRHRVQVPNPAMKLFLVLTFLLGEGFCGSPSVQIGMVYMSPFSSLVCLFGSHCPSCLLWFVARYRSVGLSWCWSGLGEGWGRPLDRRSCRVRFGFISISPSAGRLWW